MNRILSRIKGDKVIWVVIITLSIISMMAVYSSTGALAYRKQAGNTEYYLIRHFAIMVFGISFTYVCHLLKYTFYAKFAKLLMIVSIPLLLFTLTSGSEINEASRWMVIPVINISFQTSDFAKLATVIFLAFYLTKNQETITDFKTGFIKVFYWIIPVIGLILPANFSTAALLGVTCMVMLFVGRAKIVDLAKITAVMTLLFIVFVTIVANSPDSGRVGTWKNRIDNFVSESDPEANYQADQSKIAIASGYPFGKGPGKSTQRNFLPHPYSDFIFAIIIEEFGFLGGFIIVVLYLILLFRGIRIAIKSPGSFGAFLAIGISFIIVLQAMVNMAVAVNLIPVTGQPLPLVSMGGTSLWFTSISLGILLSVSKEIENEDLSEIKEVKNKINTIKEVIDEE
ncbi:MAG: FtsW/RodA/SpoVE family cell cycle protein [Bacteroidales bacterium]|nr:FtsW/RodA/SpoVE family cell cycle protein [Bacteroidales bacterium]MDY0216039.1 FtsW/RodA/SpoVE family cell cycle protein [Bacteroidales bacterium]